MTYYSDSYEYKGLSSVSLTCILLNVWKKSGWILSRCYLAWYHIFCFTVSFFFFPVTFYLINPVIHLYYYYYCYYLFILTYLSVRSSPWKLWAVSAFYCLYFALQVGPVKWFMLVLTWGDTEIVGTFQFTKSRLRGISSTWWEGDAGRDRLISVVLN